MNNDFNVFLSTGLNPEQKAAVTKKDGILLVCAGAGSGKTRVITARMTHLILNEQVAPHQLIALTFTNKAAREMKERMIHFLPSKNQLPYVGTFHSYCLQLLKSNAHLLDIPDFSIMDSDDQKKLLQKIITATNPSKKITATSIAAAISRLKNDALDGVVSLNSLQDPTLHGLFRLYEEEKRKARCLDFDDLLLETLKLFKRNPNFTSMYQQRVRHILIDEYQDTNQVQHALLKAMITDHTGHCIADSLCIVGDEDQSIYSWRGATVSNILNFRHEFPATQTVTIDQNYRSVQPILEVANQVIKHNSNRNPKKLWSTKQGSDRIRVVQTASGYQEGDLIAALSKKTHALTPQATIAVLYRSHYQSRSIEEILIRSSVPYKIIGGIQFYERQEIKDLLAYLRLTTNPFDRVSFMRIFNVPSRGLGDKFEELFFELWDQEPFLAWHQIAQKLIEEKIVTGLKQAKLQHFITVFDGLEGTLAPSVALNTIIQRIDYFGYLTASFEKEEAHTKSDNVKELMNAVKAVEESGTTTVAKFLDEVALLQEHLQQPVDEQNCLLLMTCHAAKGLEFDTVILAGVEDGVLPSSRSLYEPDALEEERRLLYVGITRARERLLITYARHRFTFGQMTDQMPSRFLDEIPENLAQCDNASQWRSYEVQSYVTQWLTGTVHDAYSAPAQTTQVTIPKRTPVSGFDWKKPAFVENSATVRTVNSSGWKKYQPVQHATFGVGVIEAIEEKNPTTTYLTIKFSGETKKIDAKFVKAV